MSNSQPNKLKSGIKNGTPVTLLKNLSKTQLHKIEQSGG